MYYTGRRRTRADGPRSFRNRVSAATSSAADSTGSDDKPVAEPEPQHDSKSVSRTEADKFASRHECVWMVEDVHDAASLLRKSIDADEVPVHASVLSEVAALFDWQSSVSPSQCDGTSLTLSDVIDMFAACDIVLVGLRKLHGPSLTAQEFAATGSDEHMLEQLTLLFASESEDDELKVSREQFLAVLHAHCVYLHALQGVMSHCEVESGVKPSLQSLHYASAKRESDDFRAQGIAVDFRSQLHRSTNYASLQTNQRSSLKPLSQPVPLVNLLCLQLVQRLLACPLTPLLHRFHNQCQTQLLSEAAQRLILSSAMQTQANATFMSIDGFTQLCTSADSPLIHVPAAQRPRDFVGACKDLIGEVGAMHSEEDEDIDESTAQQMELPGFKASQGATADELDKERQSLIDSSLMSFTQFYRYCIVTLIQQHRFSAYLIACATSIYTEFCDSQHASNSVQQVNVNLKGETCAQIDLQLRDADRYMYAHCVPSVTRASFGVESEQGEGMERFALHRTLHAALLHVFDAGEEEILRLMSADSFTRFKASPLFAQLLDALQSYTHMNEKETKLAAVAAIQQQHSKDRQSKADAKVKEQTDKLLNGKATVKTSNTPRIAVRDDSKPSGKKIKDTTKKVESPEANADATDDAQTLIHNRHASQECDVSVAAAITAAVLGAVPPPSVGYHVSIR